MSLCLLSMGTPCSYLGRVTEQIEVRLSDTDGPGVLTVCLVVLLFSIFINQSKSGYRVYRNCTISFLQRILCETVKDFVAKVEKAYEKTLENAVVADAVANKVRTLSRGVQGFQSVNVDLALQLRGLSDFSCQNIINQGESDF